MQSCFNRIEKEYKALVSAKQNQEGFSVVVMPDREKVRWNAEIKGPTETPYAGGTFLIDIEFPAQYPYVPPKMKFLTKIWHPNISSQTGVICLDILKDEWTPALSIRTALLSLQALLSVPEPDNPQDAVVAKEYKSNRQLFERTAKAWVEKYACGSSLYDDKLRRLVDMGFPEEQAREALVQVGGNEEEAIERLASL